MMLVSIKRRHRSQAHVFQVCVCACVCVKESVYVYMCVCLCAFVMLVRLNGGWLDMDLIDCSTDFFCNMLYLDTHNIVS